MSTKICALGLSLLAGACALAMPAVSFAGNVGYYEMCSGQGEAWQASLITAAGQTPVLITTPDSTSLNNLAALFVTNCDNDGYAAEYTANLAAINGAVTTHGMTLIMHDRHVTNATAILPNSGSITFTRDYLSGGSDINFPAGSPVINGPGGPLNDSSLDGYSYSSHGYITISTLPANSFAYAVRADAARATLVDYPAGAGRVVYSTSPLDAFQGSVNWNAYAINLLAGIHFSPTASCASEGYKGAQLTWCKNICENGLTGQVLDTWIHRWINRYRDLPACAAGGGEPGGTPQ